MTLTLIWVAILAFIIIMYVILDGFDLGIGILFPFVHEHESRDIMMNSIAPVWDGNETWLVFGGAVLYGAFPLASGTLLPALYMPVILMLIALIFRGVSFEFRFKAHTSRYIWDWAFFLGSLFAAFLQGVILGTFVRGFELTPEELIIPNNPWLTPFSLMTGMALVAGYALLGATWMIIKSHGHLQALMYRYAKRLLLWLAVFMLIVSIWTPFNDPKIVERWFSWPNLLYLSPLPSLTIITFFVCWFALQDKQHEIRPFLLSIALFLFAYLGLAISIWPYIVPLEITFFEAAAPATTQIFILVGTVIILPVLLLYTAYAYKVFKGKVDPDAGYH